VLGAIAHELALAEGLQAHAESAAARHDRPGESS
jgi:hypothetical protein